MKKDPAQFRNTFHCPNCEGHPEFTAPGFLLHLVEVHKIEDKKGKKQMTLHLNCGDQSIYQYEWTIGGLKFQQCVNLPKKETRI